MLFFTQSCDLLRQQPGDDVYTEKDIESKKERDTALAVKDTVRIIVKDSIDLIYPAVHKKKYNIALFLPLFLDKKSQDEAALERISQSAQDIYMGIQHALDTLRACGIDYNIRVYDTRNDSNHVKYILRRKFYSGTDLIIGPLFSRNIPAVSRHARRNKISMVSPYSVVNVPLYNNPYFLSMKPGQDVIGENAAALINRRFPGRNLVIIRTFEPYDRHVTTAFKHEIDSSRFLTIREFAIAEKDWNRMTQQLRELKTLNTVILMPTDNEVFYSSVMSVLRRKEDKDLTLVGMPEWIEFSSFEGKLMERYNLHLLSTYYENFSDPETLKLIRSFEKRFHVAPNEYAIMGYDIMVLYGRLLYRHGKYFQRGFFERVSDKEVYHAIHTNYIFEQDKSQQGWENNYMHVLKFRDFKLRKTGF